MLKGINKPSDGAIRRTEKEDQHSRVLQLEELNTQTLDARFVDAIEKKVLNVSEERQDAISIYNKQEVKV